MSAALFLHGVIQFKIKPKVIFQSQQVHPKSKKNKSKVKGINMWREREEVKSSITRLSIGHFINFLSTLKMS